MALESEIPLVPESAPHKLRPVFDGTYDEKCSVKYFRDFLPDSEGCEETSSDKKWVSHLRTFWYPDEAPSRSQPPLNLIQPKIKDFLFSLENFMPNYWGMTAFVQFWAPVTAEEGRRTLSVSKQPFAARHNLKGLCRYRYYCQELGRIGNGMDFGPVGRAYARGSLEFSPHSEVYTEDDFQLKNHAKHCGVVGYLALPVFELANGDTDGQERSCVGVLEFISFMINNLSSFDIRICMKKLKDVGLAFRYPSHSEALTQIRPYFNFPFSGDACKGELDEISSVLDLVRRSFSLPLVQVWLPCICNGSEVSIVCEPNSGSFYEITHLVCGLQCLDRFERRSIWLSMYGRCDPQVYFVEEGSGWVGRAHSAKKICFISALGDYSIVDYPLLTLENSSDLLACFAVPLQLVNPKLPPLVLEVFLPTRYKFDADQGAILKPLLSMVAWELAKYNADLGLRQDEEIFIEVNHSKNDYGCVYLDAYHRSPVVEEDYVQHQPHQPNDATQIEVLQVPTEENTRPSSFPSQETTVGGRSILKRKFPSSHESRPSRQRNDVHPIQQIPEIPTKSVGSSDEDLQPGIKYCPSGDLKEREDEAAKISNPIPTIGKGKIIVPRNDEVDNGASVPSDTKGTSTVPENGNLDHGASIPTIGERRSIEGGNDEDDNSCTMIIRARCNDDMVRFPFSSNSGIEGLRLDVLKRFELEAGRFKIKYQDDGYWIMLSCSEDLSFHMRCLKSSGQTTMDLSVFPTT